MFDVRTLSSDDRRHFYRRAAIAPLCLCLVAALQVTRVVWCNQTPWKGGGFGMFSTVDAESARFLRCYLVTDGGDLPLAIPDASQKREAELRAAPTSAATHELAERLAAQRWRWGDDLLRRERAHELEPIPAGDPGLEAIRFTAVRVECWRYRFAARSAELRAEKLLSAAVPRGEAAR